MKVGMIVITNRPDDFKQFMESMKVLGDFRERFMLFALIQPPFNGYEDFLDDVDFIEKCNKCFPPIPFVYLRKKIMNLAASYGCQWFWSLDDDHRFMDGKGDTFNKTCAEYYTEVFDHMENNPETGVITCRGYFGGYASGYDFVTNPKNGLVATDKGGIFFRNIGVDKIIEPCEERLCGALFESLATYNIMNYGFNHVRRYNSPIYSVPPGKQKRQGISDNISYCDETLNKNVQGRIRQKFNDPTWTHSSKKYPKGLI